MPTTLSLDPARALHALRAGLLAAGLALLAACGGGDDAPTIAAAPADRAVVAPATATFTANAAGDPAPTLQWQVSTDAGATWSDIVGATAASYTTAATTGADDGKRFRVVATNRAGSVTSAAARLTVAVVPTITTAPADQSVTAPDVATFSVVAAGLPAPTLQWQVSSDAGASWANIAGATASSYTTDATSTADDGKRYRAVATNSAGSATSAAAQLSVSEAPAAQTTILSFDFEAALPASVDPGSATMVGVQGFAGYGPTGNQFGGNMLRSATANTVTITLTGLPAHTWLSLEFLFAAIDSLDGTGTFPAGDFLEVKVDGVSVFNESFANSLATQIQSYVPPPGGELARRVELGFWAAYPESAYNMAIEPRFQRIAHSASSVTITFRMEGSGESLDNESWGIDNLRVVVGN